jgi:hypothetical protein
MRTPPKAEREPRRSEAYADVQLACLNAPQTGYPNRLFDNDQ